MLCLNNLDSQFEESVVNFYIVFLAYVDQQSSCIELYSREHVSLTSSYIGTCMISIYRKRSAFSNKSIQPELKNHTAYLFDMLL